MIVIKQGLTNFRQVKNECELLTKVALEGQGNNSFDWLISNVYDIKRALTNMQQVAREYRKDWKKDELKTGWYVDQKNRRDSFGTIDKRACFYQEYKDLVSKNYLSIIRDASIKMANKCMKSHRKTGAESSKRYYSLFRALERQINRLDSTLDRKVYELANATELKKQKEKSKPVIKTTEYKGKTITYEIRGDVRVVIKVKKN